MTKTVETHLPWLGGVRGLAALWVVIGIWLAMSQTKIANWRYLIASIAVACLYLAFERSTEAVARLLVVAGLFALVHAEACGTSSQCGCYLAV
jgi:hypothetical protein